MHSMRFLMLWIFLGVSVGSVLSASPDKQDKSKNDNKKRQETGQSQYYKKWIDDVSYIITDDEKSVFKHLKNDEERESFIEQFWLRRNPDPRSPINSFKEEHYRRIAYANEHFTSGTPGWKTDRGRIYIMYGKPDQIETHPTGSTYDRPEKYGGGTTRTFPFEKWMYRHIDGVGDGIELEFVDSSISNEYRLAMNYWEKEADLYVPDAGQTYAEQMGWARKEDRPAFDLSKLGDLKTPGGGDYFKRMEDYFIMQRPPKIKFPDLKTLVTTNVYYDDLPYDVKTDFIKLTAEKALALITINLNNSDLEFKREQDINRAKVNVYGIVTGLNYRIRAEWDDEIGRNFNDLYFFEGKNKSSKYQRMIALSPGQLYKLDLVLKDANSKKMGTTTIRLNVPKFEENELQTSTIILAENITQAARVYDATWEQFVIGDMRIVPKVNAEYEPNQNLVPYMQIYNMEIDQATHKPSLNITFTVNADGKVVKVLDGTPFNAEQFYYGQRVVLVGKIPLNYFALGKYSLEIKVQDNISNRSITTSTDFMVWESKPANL
jgi:GWxTD domain-containing protein